MGNSRLQPTHPSREHPGADPGRQRRRRHHDSDRQLLPVGRTPPERHADDLPGRQPRFPVPVPPRIRRRDQRISRRVEEPTMSATTTEILTDALKRAAAAHGVYEAEELGGKHHDEWPEWYAE